MSLLRHITALLLTMLPLLTSAATRVTVEPLEKFLIYPEQSAPAQVMSLNDTDLSAQISAQISAIDVRAGDRVKKGETLVRLDCRDARLAHESALARLSLAEKNARRARALKQSSSIAEQSYNAALTEEIQARVNEKQTALQVRRCQVRAPFDGIIVERLAAVGELASPGTPLLRLLDSSEVEVSARVPADALATLQRLDGLTFRFDGHDYPVERHAVLPRIDPTSGNRELRLRFTADAALPGSNGRLRWRLETPHISPALLSQRNGQTGIFVARDGRAAFVPLPQAIIGRPVPTTLPPETPVIVDGRFGLHDGDAIEVAN